MESSRAGLVLAVTASIVFAASATGARAQGARTDDLAIVVNPATPVSQLTFGELRQVFMGDRQYWTPDQPVVLLVRAPTSTERDAVLNLIYQMREPQFKQYWIAKMFRAEATASPKILISNQLTEQILAATPGAIAFLPAADVKPPLKILKIDGLLPGEPGYRLHLRHK